MKRYRYISPFFALLACLASISPVSAVIPVPASDPNLDPAEHAPFNDALLGVHPRLLFNAAELAQLQADIASPPLLAHYNQLLGYLGSSKAPTSPNNFQTNATEAQRQGLWRMPTVALHYALTGSTTSRDRTIEYMQWIYGYSTWENGGEQDSGMAAANMMVGAAICYDIMYNYLAANDPTFLENYRQKLFHHARQMWHRGHDGGQGGYWQVDPQNNHRQHRDAGLVLCMLAAYEGNPEEEWLLRKVFDEAQFLQEYLPSDGTSHESSSYQAFGGAHLTLALEAADNCFGTNYLDSAFYQNVARFRIQSIAPGFGHFFMYGDMGDDTGSYNQYNMLAADRFQQADLQDALDHLFSVKPNTFEFAWMGVIWRGTSQLGGDYQNLPLFDHFEDLGITFMREGWDNGDAGAMFISGAPGGLRLNEYRNDVINGGYVNVAHDDPNANSFILFKDDEWVAETDRYSHNKRSANHNTILVDGVGQRPNGRTEGPVYLQPGTGGQDMTTMAYITWEEDNGDTVVTEGEAAVAYRGALTRFRRSFVWRAGEYVLVLDDIRAGANRQIKWLMQSGTVTTRNAGNLQFTLEKGAADCEFDVDATQALTVSKVTSPADNRTTILGFQQLQLTAAATQNLQVASAYDLFDKGNLNVTLSNVTSTGATVTVTGNGVNDQWDWTFAPDNNTASTIALAKAPTIFAQPSGDTDISVNESALLNVRRGGLGPVTYQWYRGMAGDTSNPVGGNAPTLDTGALGEPTWYWVRITSGYGATDSNAFYVDLTNGFIVWLTDAGAGNLTEGGDPDFDGIANLIEYALGLNPMASQVRRPGITVAGEPYAFRFNIPETPLMDARYEVQVSTTLAADDWTTVLTKTTNGPWTGSATFSQGNAANGLIPVTVTITPGQFVRLKITRI